MKYLDKEEQELIESYDKGEWKPVKKKDLKVYAKAAKESLSKNK